MAQGLVLREDMLESHIIKNQFRILLQVLNKKVMEKDIMVGVIWEIKFPPTYPLPSI